jgi:hypothetical protein
LKNSLAGLNSGSKQDSTLDTNQILMRINMLSDELKKKADKTEL